MVIYLDYDSQVCIDSYIQRVKDGSIKEVESGLTVLEIAKAISETTKDLSPLQKNIKQVGKLLTYIILFFAFITFLIEVLIRGNPLESLLTAIAISVAAWVS